MRKHWTEVLYPTELINLFINYDEKSELERMLYSLIYCPSFDRYDEYCDNKYWEIICAITKVANCI